MPRNTFDLVGSRVIENRKKIKVRLLKKNRYEFQLIRTVTTTSVGGLVKFNIQETELPPPICVRSEHSAVDLECSLAPCHTAGNADFGDINKL